MTSRFVALHVRKKLSYCHLLNNYLTILLINHFIYLLISPLTSRRDRHLTLPHNLPVCVILQTVYEIRLAHQLESLVRIRDHILLSYL